MSSWSLQRTHHSRGAGKQGQMQAGRIRHQGNRPHRLPSELSVCTEELTCKDSVTGGKAVLVSKAGARTSWERGGQLKLDGNARTSSRELASA